MYRKLLEKMKQRNYTNIYKAYSWLPPNIIYKKDTCLKEILIKLCKGGYFMDEKPMSKAHKLTLNNRRTGIINGVSDVLSFDISEILLETEQGMLMIKGNDLHVNRLTLEKGEVEIEGRIDSLTYSEIAGYNKQGESFLQRLFK